MSDPLIVVTRKWPEPVEAELLARYPSARLNADDVPLGHDMLRRALETADVVLPTVSDRLPADLFTGLLRTRFLGNFGVGYNHIDIDTAARAGIVVTNTPGVLTDTTADTAMTLLLMIARRAGEGEREPIPPRRRPGQARRSPGAEAPWPIGNHHVIDPGLPPRRGLVRRFPAD
jgi:lactate dehydrogenase-like 2-hydroxyacid dehydrogenase